MFLLRSLLRALRKAADSTFQQGTSGEEVILRRLRAKLRVIKGRARKMARASAALVLMIAPVTVAAACVDLDVRVRVTGTLVLLLLLLGAALGAVESFRVTMLLDALEDLLIGGAVLRPLDVVAVFRDRIQEELSEAPRWSPLVDELAAAYDSSKAARFILQRAHVPVGHVDFDQAMIPLWRDALRVADRAQKLAELVRTVVADPNVQAHHRQVEAIARTIFRERRRDMESWPRPEG